MAGAGARREGEAGSGRLLVDGHLDLAMNALEYNRDLTRPVAEIRAREGEAGRRDAGTCTVALPELRRAGVFLCCATVHARIAQHSSSLGGWASPHIAAAVARGQLAYYEGLAAAGELAIVTSGAELAAHYRKWASCSPAHDTVPSGQEAAFSTQDAARPIGIILLMECADPLLGPEDLAQWVQWGVRAVGPAHFGPNVYAHGTGSEGGLTAAGRTLLQWMERFHLVLDTSHLAPQAFWEALDAFSGPVMASHSNCRTLVPGDRQLDDKQMGAIIAREGVIGIALEIGMLKPRGDAEVGRDHVRVEDVARHIDHVCQLSGDALHVALGTDLDGGFGRERIPRELDSVADVPRLAEALTARGYSEADLDNIFWGNWLRFWQRVLPPASSRSN